MDTHNRLDLFEPGDKTALICLDVPEMQRIAIEHLHALGYKIHTGISTEDLLLKMRTNPYDVILIGEHFGASDLVTNPLIIEIMQTPTAQRMRQYIALVGPTFSTGDENQAFLQSVDLVVNLADLLNLKAVLRRGVTRTAEFRQRYLDALEALDQA